MRYLLAFFIVLTSMNVHADECNLELKVYSSNDIKRDRSLKLLETMDPGHHKYVVDVHDLPESPRYSMNIKRTAVKTPIKTLHMSKEQFYNGIKAGISEYPSMVISSRGYMPGEKVEIWIDYGYDKSNSIAFVPNPSFMTKGNLHVKSEIISAFPALYALKFSGLEPNEVVTLKSKSGGETIKTDVKINEENSYTFAPEVVGIAGGCGTVSVTRKNGETLSVKLPWGQLLQRYLEGRKQPMVKQITQSNI